MGIAAVEVGDSVQQSLDSFFNFLPNLIAFAVILAVGFLIARVLGGVARKALEKLGIDRALHDSDAGRYVERISPGAKPSNGVGRAVFWLAMVFVVAVAIGALKIPAVTGFMNQVLSYMPNVIAAIVIFVVAAAIAGAAGTAVTKLMGDTTTGKLVAAIVPTLVLVIGLFMVLNQLKIAEEIVTIAFAALLGSLGLGMALAFGLGGRDVAGRLLDEAYRKGQEERGRIRRDMEVGKERAKDQAQQAGAGLADGRGPGATAMQ
jgi:hypothetical protein